jgi:hypothetical protein
MDRHAPRQRPQFGYFGRCDTRSHVVSEFRRLEVRHDAEDVTSGSCSRPVPALTCAAGNGRVRSSGEARGRPSRPGATGEGKAGRVNDPESLLMPRQSDIPGRCAVRGWQGPAVARRQTATADVPMVAGNTVARAAERHGTKIVTALSALPDALPEPAKQARSAPGDRTGWDWAGPGMATASTGPTCSRASRAGRPQPDRHHGA